MPPPPTGSFSVRVPRGEKKLPFDGDASRVGAEQISRCHPQLLVHFHRIMRAAVATMLLLAAPVASLVLPAAPVMMRSSVSACAATSMRCSQPEMLAEFAQPESVNAVMQNALMLADASSEVTSSGQAVVVLGAFVAVIYAAFTVIRVVAPWILQLGFVAFFIEAFGGIVPPP